MTLLLSTDVIARAPKVLLHDHLDGGLRPQTMIDHALASGYTKLPSYNSDELATWFVNACSSGTLELYLETFEHTISVMQTKEEIEKNPIANLSSILQKDASIYIRQIGGLGQGTNLLIRGTNPNHVLL